MTPEQREIARANAQRIVNAGGIENADYAVAVGFLSLIAQVEALTRKEKALQGLADLRYAEVLELTAQLSEALAVPQGAPTAEQYDEMLRALCCQYGVGGYNSDGLIDPKAAESKLRFALDEQFRVGGELSFNGARGELRDAAAAVVARWDSPKWKDEAPTAEFIARLRQALAAPTIPAIPGTKEGA